MRALRSVHKKAKRASKMSTITEEMPEDAEEKNPFKYSYWSVGHKKGRGAKHHVSKNAGKNLAFEAALRVCDCMNRISEVVEMKISETPLPEETKEQKVVETEDYMTIMREKAFDTIENSFRSQKYKARNVTMSRKLMKRLATEFTDFPDSLPINPESSVFFRACESDLPRGKMMIIPADGTPYGGGCFIFDVCFPTKYPMVPPLVSIETTGGGTVRFNPNLYKNGKVCLSLIGTWKSKNQGETWNPGFSTMLQVAISIQALIFVAEPYYNEPGYESRMGTAEGKKRSERYNKPLQKATVQHAMIEQLRNPPPCFEDVIKTHFRLQKERTLRNARSWLGDDASEVAELEELINDL